MAINKGTAIEYYCVRCEVLGSQNIEELLVNINLFVLRVWGEQYREELILNVTVLFVSVWGGQYREKLILNLLCL